jgi:4a-hydroxytetrahydrobiopterin dehydratase
MATTKNPALDEASLKTALAQHPGWTQKDKSLVRTWQAKTFPEGIALIDRVAEVAQAMDHHPDIFIAFNQVTFTLSTHDAGGITQLDLKLAKSIDELAEKAGAKPPVSKAK